MSIVKNFIAVKISNRTKMELRWHEDGINKIRRGIYKVALATSLKINEK